MNTSLVSVIIPTYNRAKILKYAIDSVFAQTYKNIQVIVVDDGSTDATAELMKQFPQVEYVIQPHAGQAAARNMGLKHAKGTIIASLDSDDVWHPDFLQKCVDKLEGEKLDFVFTNWLQYSESWGPTDFLSDDPDLTPYFKRSSGDWITLSPAEARKLYLSTCPSPSSSVVMRKSSIVSGWDETIIIGDDWCMYLDMILAKECKVAFTLQVLWKKRVDALNIFDGRKRNEILKYLYIEDSKTMLKKFRDVLFPKEIRQLEKRYIESLVELAKHEILREQNFAEANRLIKVGFELDKLYTIQMIPYVLLVGINRRIDAVKVKAAQKKHFQTAA
ncbi:MAG: glycosyltransferase family 2 protein [Bacteroidota bacterium]